MTSIASTTEPAASLAPPLVRLFAGVRSLWTAHRARRARRLALLTLMEFEPHRLDDLGISVADLAAALGRAR